MAPGAAGGLTAPGVGRARGKQSGAGGRFFFWGGDPPGARKVPTLRYRPVPTGGATRGGAPASPGGNKGGSTGTGTGRDGPGRAPPALLRRCPARCRRYRAPEGDPRGPGGTGVCSTGGLDPSRCHRRVGLWPPPAQFRVPGGAFRCSGAPGRFGEVTTRCPALGTGGPVGHWGGPVSLPVLPGGYTCSPGVPGGTGAPCPSQTVAPVLPNRLVLARVPWHRLGTPGAKGSSWAPRFQPGHPAPSPHPEGPQLTHRGTLGAWSWLQRHPGKGWQLGGDSPSR